MRLLRPLFFGLFFLLLASVPTSAYAQGAGSIFAPIFPAECKCARVAVEGSTTGGTSPSAPSWGCTLKVVQNVINTVVGLGVVILILAIVYAGFVFMTSGANPNARTQGRRVVTNAAVGLIILLAAWLFIDFIMKMVYSPTAVLSGDTRLGPWNAIWSATADSQCLVVREPTPITTGFVELVIGIATESPGGGGGTCTPSPSGPCSVASLTPYFSGTAAQAAMICNAESGGVINMASQTDKMRNDPRHRSFSFGLFQINITQHSVGGLNCPNAFNGRNYSATVRDENLYRQCASAAQTMQHNIAEAVVTHNRSGWREWSTARQCGLAYISSRLALEADNNAGICRPGALSLII